MSVSGSQVVFVGAGHAHLYALARIREYAARGIDVTVISPARFWYSGMGPGLLSGQYDEHEDSVDVARLVVGQGGRHIDGRVVHIDASDRAVELSDGRRLAYDALSLNVGSSVPVSDIPGAEGVAWPVKPVSHFAELRRRLRERAAHGNPVQVVVVGGGAAGCEAAANARALLREVGLSHQLTLVSASPRLLAGTSETAGRYMERWCQREAIAVDLDRRAEGVSGRTLRLSGGGERSFDELVVATGVRPPSLMAVSGLDVARDGALIVNAALQSTSHPNIFGGGDCIAWNGRRLARVGVYAIREAPILHQNLLAHLGGEPLRPFIPQKHYLLILNLGDGTGLLTWRGLVAHGRWAFRFKEWLDLRFIRHYQALTRA